MSRSRETVRGRLYDPKSRRLISTESEIERRLALSALFWSAIQSVTEQPLELKIEGESRLTYTPDFLLRFHTGERLVIEVKPYKVLSEDAALREKLSAIAQQLDAHGLLFCVVTEKDFNPAYHLSNLRQLKPYISYPLEPTLKTVEQVRSNLPMSFSAMVSMVGSHQSQALIAQKFVYADLQTPLHAETQITEGGQDEPHYFSGWYPTDNDWQAVDDH